MKLTYYGQSCIGVQLGEQHLLFDPFISDNPLAVGVELADVPATHVLLSHGHSDHVADAEAILKQRGATLIANFEICNWYVAKGIEKAHAMNIGGQVELGSFRVRSTVAQHSSSLPDGSYGGTACGYVIHSKEGNFHHAGDTALMLDMQLLKRHNLKFACLPIGDVFTMNAEDAVEAARYMGVDTVVGMHYDTFPPIEIDKQQALSRFEKAGIKLLLPSIGTTIEL